MDMAWEVLTPIHAYITKLLWLLEKRWIAQEYGEFAALFLLYLTATACIVMAAVWSKRMMKGGLRFLSVMARRRLADHRQRMLWARERKRIAAISEKTEEALKNLGEEARVPFRQLADRARRLSEEPKIAGLRQSSEESLGNLGAEASVPHVFNPHNI